MLKKLKDELIPADIREKFEQLATELSPENLAGDGEYTNAQVRGRHKHIQNEWKKLEKIVGRIIPVSEIEDEM